MTWEMIVTLVVAILGLIGSIIVCSYKERKSTGDAKDIILDKQSQKHEHLSLQHSELKELINEKCNTINHTLSNNQNKIIELMNIEAAKKEAAERTFNCEQKDIKRKVEEINDFLNDWQRLVVKCAELQSENNQLKAENLQLRRELDNTYSNECEM